MSMLDDVKDLPANQWAPFTPRETTDVIRSATRRSRQFIFNEEASRTVGNFIKNCPDIIAEQLEFAVPPYDPCYLEVDIDVMHTTMGAPTSAEILGKERDWKLGFLIIGNRIFSLVNNYTRTMPALSMFGTYEKSGRKPSTAFEPKDVTTALTGTSYLHLSDAQRHAFVEKYGIFHTFSHDDFRLVSARDHINTYVGEARTLAAVLLMLYNKKHVVLTDMPYERKMSRGKMRTFMAYTNVSLSLTNPIEIRRSFNAGDRGTNRRHEVRTHYKHLHIDRTCQHTWLRNDYSDNEQWRCSRCGGLRYLVRDFVRGDATKGFVVKKYDVKP